MGFLTIKMEIFASWMITRKTSSNFARIQSSSTIKDYISYKCWENFLLQFLHPFGKHEYYLLVRRLIFVFFSFQISVKISKGNQPEINPVGIQLLHLFPLVLLVSEFPFVVIVRMLGQVPV